MYYYPQFVPRTYDVQQPQQQPQQNMQISAQNLPNLQQNFVLQGKIVDNYEVVRAMDIPLDGSTSFFPLANESAIVTKKLKADGTSEIKLYKLSEDSQKTPQYVTEDKISELIKAEVTDINEIKEEMKIIKRQIRDFQDDIKEVQKTKRKSDD